MSPIPRRGAILASVSALIVPASARAQAEYPQRPIRLLIAYAAGGGTDAIARTLAGKLQAELGQPVVVENKPGAGGNVATEAAATARPDGYTLLMGNQGPMSVNPTLFPRFRINPETALDPVALVADAPLVFVAGPGTKATDMAGLVAALRAGKGDLTFASASNGSASHLAAALLCQMVGAEATHVPFRGAAPAITDVLAGNVAFMATTLPSVIGMLQANTGLRALAVTARRRIAQLPDVPAVAETPGLAEYWASAWYGILVPAGTPAPIRAKLGAAIRRTMTTPEVMQRLRDEGAEPVDMDGEGFAKLIREERIRWAAVIKGANIVAD